MRCKTRYCSRFQARPACRVSDPATGPWSHPNIGFSEGTDYYNTGKMGELGDWHSGPGDGAVHGAGAQRFNITCAMCHGATAAGNGITKQYGLATVVTLQDERIRKMSDGEIFDTITQRQKHDDGLRAEHHCADRWAIIAYLRALQRSQNATATDVPADHRAELEKPASPPPATAK